MHAKILLQKIRFSCAQNQCKKLHQFSDHENWFFCKAKILQNFSYFENAIAFSFHSHTSTRSVATFTRFSFSHESEIWSMSRENWSLGAFIFLDAVARPSVLQLLRFRLRPATDRLDQKDEVPRTHRGHGWPREGTCSGSLKDSRHFETLGGVYRA